MASPRTVFARRTRKARAPKAASRSRKEAFGWSSAVVALGLLACAPLEESCRPTAGTDVGNGLVISLNMTAYEAPPPAGTQSIQLSTGVTVDALWLATSRFRFRAGTDCSGSENEIDVQGPLVADLAGTGFLGGPRDIDRTSGPYCGLRLEFDPIDAKRLPSGAPADLGGLSVLMLGRRADGVSFQVRSRVNGEFRLDATSQSFELAKGTDSLLIAFELGRLTSALGVEGLSGNPILIDDKNNEDALKSFEDALKASADLYRDGNGDGSLEPNESGSGQALAKGSP